ncbi:hypothetical protein A3J56_00110 [Candidatus Giovannonibacteria bacterium RIFCSPHIGHO2_02_FULL_46_20]|uniref:CARDB domain-containing protein n=1 Tax=Candidatus Giovannonibacteria bacterium RIFCSPHIGHO2_02_FULL_46_20 TaxID=1798338 RepID=A0A1F5WDE4_9BACT|nr:MAG: hypothetical protein A3J56_00110 [Candidatus Giovannonibacteria bacterium RIFCSPHIGHO2_02_FULL_46_20]
MKNKLIYGFLAIFIVGLLSLSFVSAENAAPAADLQALVQQLQNQIKELQDQLAKLKTEVQEAKEELKLTKNLRKGLSDDEVKGLQKFLSQYQEIYPEGLITGFYGSLTEKAVKKFQEKFDIPATGLVGPLTREKINESLAREEKEEKIVICHVPLGSPALKHTLTIGKLALEAHLAHGDAIGACPAEPTPAPTPCTESWSCGGWSSCINSAQTRTCADANNCGTTNSKPPLNQSCTPTPVSTPKGTDLEISNLYPAHNYAGQSNNFIAGIMNRGSTVIPKGFVIKFYINNAYIGEYAHPVDLLPGWGGGFGINYTFINPGIYEVKAVVDGNNAVAELSEDNNTIIAKLNIITPSSSLPDLQVTGLSMMHIYANQPNTIIASIKNVGLGTAGSFTAKLYVDGGYVGEETRPGTTSPGSSVGMATKYTFTTVGPHELKVIVDSNSAVVEESEENNVMVRTTYLQ